MVNANEADFTDIYRISLANTAVPSCSNVHSSSSRSKSSNGGGMDETNHGHSVARPHALKGKTPDLTGVSGSLHSSSGTASISWREVHFQQTKRSYHCLGYLIKIKMLIACLQVRCMIPLILHE